MMVVLLLFFVLLFKGVICAAPPQYNEGYRLGDIVRPWHVNKFNNDWDRIRRYIHSNYPGTIGAEYMNNTNIVTHNDGRHILYDILLRRVKEMSYEVPAT